MDKLWPEWHEQAACSNAGYEQFFGTDSEARPALTVKQVSQVRALCMSCPVFRTCLTHALEQREEYGIWAGTTGRARRKIRKVLDEGEVTVQEVVEDYANGRRRKYEGRGPGRPNQEQGVARVPAEVGRVEPERDRRPSEFHVWRRGSQSYPGRDDRGRERYRA